MTKFQKYIDECIEKESHECEIIDKGLINLLDISGIFLLKQLSRLTLSHNKIEVLPPSIIELENLEILNCFNNLIEEIPANIASLPKLKILNLAFNKLTFLPRGFGSCPSLEVLDLTYNNLNEKSIPSNFFMLNTLRALYLGDNEFEVIDTSFGKLRHLQILHFRDNQLIYLPKELSFLMKIKEFNVSGNRLTVLPPELSELEVIGNKQVFKLENNPWLPPIADQLQLGISHLFTYIKTQTYQFLYNRHVTAMENDASLIPPPKQNSKGSRLKKI